MPRPKLRPAVVVSNLLAWSVAAVWLLPFIGLFMTSTRPFEEVVIRGWWSPWGNYTIRNYIEVLANPQYDLAGGFRNSLIVAIPSTLAPLLVAAMAAYAFARFSFVMRNLLFVLILVVMAIPQQTMVIPLFFLLKDLGLLDKLLGVILIHSSWGIAWIAFFMRNYFTMLPSEVEEAARVDGASYPTIFLRIVLPMSIPALAAAAAIQFTWVWADFFFALIFLYSPENMVITQKVVAIKGQYQIDWGLLSAGSILAMIPPILLYAALQKYYLRGMVGWATGKG